MHSMNAFPGNLTFQASKAVHCPRFLSMSAVDRSSSGILLLLRVAAGCFSRSFAEAPC